MVRTLNDNEVVRLVRKHCSEEVNRFFRRMASEKPGLVTMLLNESIRTGPYAEAEVMQKIKHVLWQLKKTGDA